MKNIIFLGPPGSGKGTQAARLSAKYGYLSVSTGQLMRQEVQNQTPLGLHIQDILSSGALVEDETVMELLRNWFQNQAHSGAPAIILDGFPRTLNQAHRMQEAELFVHQIHCFDIADELIIERLSGRRVHVPSGRTYHIQYYPPKNEGQDDLTGEPIVQRSDDSRQSIEKRLKEYHIHTQPLMAFYKDMSKQYPEKIKFFSYDAGNDAETLFLSLEQTILTL